MFLLPGYHSYITNGGLMKILVLVLSMTIVFNVNASELRKEVSCIIRNGEKEIDIKLGAFVDDGKQYAVVIEKDNYYGNAVNLYEVVLDSQDGKKTNYILKNSKIGFSYDKEVYLSIEGSKGLFQRRYYLSNNVGYGSSGGTGIINYDCTVRHN